MMEANVVKSMVQCPFCFAIPPNKKFYCCKNSHKICEHCWERLANLTLPAKKGKHVERKQKCPMGDCDYNEPPFRNLEVEEMIRNYELDVNCVYYHDGCQVTGVRAVMGEHETKCGCREVPCPNSECKIKLQLRLLFSHIKEVHPDSVVKEDKEGTSDEFFLTCLLKDEFIKHPVSTWVTIIWNHRNGQSFFPMFEKRDGAWFAWIFVQGNQEEADRWESVIRVRGPGNKSSLEYRGPVYPVDMRGLEIMRDMQCLALSNKQVDMMKVDLIEEERNKDFNAKIIVSFEAKMVEVEPF